MPSKISIISIGCALHATPTLRRLGARLLLQVGGHAHDVEFQLRSTSRCRSPMRPKANSPAFILLNSFRISSDGVLLATILGWRYSGTENQLIVSLRAAPQPLNAPETPVSSRAAAVPWRFRTIAARPCCSRPALHHASFEPGQDGPSCSGLDIRYRYSSNMARHNVSHERKAKRRARCLLTSAGR